MEEGEDPEKTEMTAANTFMECSIYQNYTASEVMVQGLAGVVNQGDVEEMVRAQKEMLQRFEKTNEMLTNVNSLSAVRLEKVRVTVIMMLMINNKVLIVRLTMILRSTRRISLR